MKLLVVATYGGTVAEIKDCPTCDSGCPMTDIHYYYKGGCSEFIKARPEETVAIIEKWAAERKWCKDI